MSDDHTDQTLRELGEAVEAFRAEYAAAQAHADRLDEEAERLLEQCPSSSEPTHATPEPHRAALSLRVRLAEQSARKHRDAVRVLVAWWADAAMVAVLSVIRGKEPDPVRLAAADPCAWMRADDLERLPAISKFDRDLADPALVLAGCPGIADFAVEQREYADSAGLTLGAESGGDARLVEGGLPEARRRRLWGDVWQEHGLPLLPETTQFIEALVQRGVPSETINAIQKASTAVESALTARTRTIELEQQLQEDEVSGEAEQAAYAEIDALMNLDEGTDDVLATYARMLTAALPAIRSACRAG